MINKRHRGIYISPDSVPKNVRYTFYPYLCRCKCKKSEVMTVIMATDLTSACSKAAELRCKDCPGIIESSIRLLSSEYRYSTKPVLIAKYGEKM